MRDFDDIEKVYEELGFYRQLAHREHLDPCYEIEYKINKLENAIKDEDVVIKTELKE